MLQEHFSSLHFAQDVKEPRSPCGGAGAGVVHEEMQRF